MSETHRVDRAKLRDTIVEGMRSGMHLTEGQLDELGRMLMGMRRRKAESDGDFIYRSAHEANVFMLMKKLGVGRQTALTYIRNTQERLDELRHAEGDEGGEVADVREGAGSDDRDG